MTLHNRHPDDFGEHGLSGRGFLVGALVAAVLILAFAILSGCDPGIRPIEGRPW